MVSSKFQKAYFILCWVTLGLIALGGSVRAMNAGLACPDWPLCFGDVIPDYHPQVYFEFLHRVLAGLVAIAVVVMNSKILRNPKASGFLKTLCWGSFALLLAQIIMGGLTVLMQLHAKVVALHLAMGTGLFAILFWIYFQISEQVEVKRPAWLGGVALFVLAVVYGQIILGGLVASHYAALVCTDFPLCHGSFIPTFKGSVGLQVLHRLGAYFTTAVILALFYLVRRADVSEVVKKWSNILFALILLQVAVGIANIKLFTPPLITVMHLTLGTCVLGAALRMYYLTKKPATPRS